MPASPDAIYPVDRLLRSAGVTCSRNSLRMTESVSQEHHRGMNRPLTDNAPAIIEARYTHSPAQGVWVRRPEQTIDTSSGESQNT
jgi:hypothetical protein